MEVQYLANSNALNLTAISCINICTCNVRIHTVETCACSKKTYTVIQSQNQKNTFVSYIMYMFYVND